MMDGIGDFLSELGRAILYLIIVASFFTAIANLGLAPDAGSPFFPIWMDVTRYGWQALLLVIPGVGGAAYVVYELFLNSDGF